jgi:heme oxygenase
LSPNRPIDKPAWFSEAHSRLREATQPQHQSLERRSDVIGRVLTPEGRREVVAGFHRLHAGLETGLARWLGEVDGLDFEGRRRGPLLEADLRALGVPVLLASGAPRAGGRGEALGQLYVLEGSALGGAVIRKQVLKSGGDLAGLGFLNPYGDAVGARWRSLLSIIAREAAAGGGVEPMITGAWAAFAFADACLSADPVDV